MFIYNPLGGKSINIASLVWHKFGTYAFDPRGESTQPQQIAGILNTLNKIN